ncbi:MAG: hypothetical protein FE78DRAFT_533762 [Acidomyces sp. 'richmondensis']|nr:MAG: hypothetical protein FE78DRAFT_533762 [Acidomyces sp. 'richmondensis']
MAFMRAQREGQKYFFDTFPIDRLKLSNLDHRNGRILIVDVGGATGHQCIALRQTSGLLGKMVLQDHAIMLAKANAEELASHKVDVQIHDFFTEQPVKNAKAYYLRNVMHDWNDESCIKILQRLREACSDDSMILIDEMVLPDHGATRKQTQKDVQMMACLAAIERSRSQWEHLLGNTGLAITKVCTYDTEMGDAVIIAMKA